MVVKVERKIRDGTVDRVRSAEYVDSEVVVCHHAVDGIKFRNALNAPVQSWGIVHLQKTPCMEIMHACSYQYEHGTGEGSARFLDTIH